MTRVVVAIVSCASALLVGVVTAFVSAANRARGGELDQRQHLCETFSRQSELLRAANAEEEWHLLGEPGEAADLRDPGEDGVADAHDSSGSAETLPEVEF